MLELRNFEKKNKSDLLNSFNSILVQVPERKKKDLSKDFNDKKNSRLLSRAFLTKFWLPLLLRLFRFLRQERRKRSLFLIDRETKDASSLCEIVEIVGKIVRDQERGERKRERKREREEERKRETKKGRERYEKT